MTTQTAGERTRLTTAEFDRLVAEGKILEGSRTYLWDGEIIEPMPENPPHYNAVDRLRRRLEARLPEEDWTVFAGHPIVLTDGYQPQPDVAVLRGPQEFYAPRKPTPADVALLVEVADTTYPESFGKFLRRYALEGIPQYWIVNIPERRVEVYTDPDPAAGSYGGRRDYPWGTTVPLMLVRQGAAHGFEGIGVEDILHLSIQWKE